MYARVYFSIIELEHCRWVLSTVSFNIVNSLSVSGETNLVCLVLPSSTSRHGFIEEDLKELAQSPFLPPYIDWFYSVL